MIIEAAVLDEVNSEFAIEEVVLDGPADHEILVEMVGVGICHTDLAVSAGHLPFAFPGVLGHEGSGIVRKIGSEVTKFAVGDRVCLSYQNCDDCPSCEANDPTYCENFRQYNFGGVRPDGTHTLSRNGEQLSSNFFGQSSFATYALATELNAVKVPEGIPLVLAGPLGCGIQTGAGAVLNSLQATPGSTVLVTGGGSVGLAAVMAARIARAETIIVVEPLAQRRSLALELGATDVVDPMTVSMEDAVRSIAPRGANYAVDTTAIPAVLAELTRCMSIRGKVGMVGVPTKSDAELSANLLNLNTHGLEFRGIREGDSDRTTFIPELMNYYLQNRFPIEKLVTKVPFHEISEGINMLETGEATKVILTFGDDGNETSAGEVNE